MRCNLVPIQVVFLTKLPILRGTQFPFIVSPLPARLWLRQPPRQPQRARLWVLRRLPKGDQGPTCGRRNLGRRGVRVGGTRLITRFSGETAFDDRCCSFPPLATEAERRLNQRIEPYVKLHDAVVSICKPNRYISNQQTFKLTSWR